MDVTTAFLYGILEEEVYMEQPDGYAKIGQENKVCRLKKSIYGLKQSPRCWNQRIHAHFIEKGFKRSLNDTAIYFQGEADDLILLGLYVDDIIIVSKGENAIKQIKDNLEREFKMVDQGEIKSILGLKVSRQREKGILFL